MGVDSILNRAILNRVAREGLTEKIIFGQRHEGGDQSTQGDNGGRVFQKKDKSPKAEACFRKQQGVW